MKLKIFARCKLTMVGTILNRMLIMFQIYLKVISDFAYHPTIKIPEVISNLYNLKIITYL